MYKFILICIYFMTASADAQNPLSDQQIRDKIHWMDSVFWLHYNQCDVEGMMSFIAADFEFYHDKNGITKGLEKFEATTKNNLCNNPNWRLRRDVVPGSVSIYPLGQYGAIIRGEHVFYIVENGEPPRLDGQANFTHVWLKQADDSWKMARVLSYDHRPATYRPSKP